MTLDDRDALARAFGRHRRLIAEQSLDPSTLWRGIEAHAEALAAAEASELLRRWIDGPGAAALSMTPSESLGLLLADRLRMGRFAAAMLLASELARRDDASEAARSWALRVRSRLIDATGSSPPHDAAPAPTPHPVWWEPPGRSQLAVLVAERLADSEHPSARRPTQLSQAQGDTPRAVKEPTQ